MTDDPRTRPSRRSVDTHVDGRTDVQGLAAPVEESLDEESPSKNPSPPSQDEVRQRMEQDAAAVSQELRLSQELVLRAERLLAEGTLVFAQDRAGQQVNPAYAFVTPIGVRDDLADALADIEFARSERE